MADNILVMRDAVEQLNAASKHVAEQDKVIDNLTETISVLNGEKAKKREKERLAALQTYKTAKNPSYGQSVWIGIRESILYAPMALFHDLKLGISAFVASVFLIIGGAAMFCLRRIGLLILGLAGRLTPQKERK